ncbi:MAG: alcohol dehydrogenase catalytic domain-containing protein [bacterium]|nr:alcohol dehydrogenase catalytic domain-containing protein [bacterium]
MKVGMYYSNSDVRVEEMPIPDVGAGELLIKIKASGICGSDVMEWYRIKRAPLVLGHELTGEVAQVGKGVDKFSPGDRVFAIHHVPCEECLECTKGHHTACKEFQTINNFEPGGFSEYLKVSGKSVNTGVMKLPDSMAYDIGTFIEPLGTVLRGQRSVGLTPGDSVIVVGSGLSGLLHIKAAKALGAGTIISVDIEDSRLDAAKKAGATYVVKATEDVPGFLKSVNSGRLADRVIVCAGALGAVEQSLSLVERGGTLLLFAVPKPGETIPVDFNGYWRNDISIKTSYGSAPLDHFQAIELLKNKRISVSDMITHRLAIDNIQEGFNLAAEGKNALKVIIEFPESSAE